MEMKVNEALRRKENQLALKRAQNSRSLQEKKTQRNNLDLFHEFQVREIQDKIEDKVGRDRPITTTNQRALELKEKQRHEQRQQKERINDENTRKTQELDQKKKEKLEQAEALKKGVADAAN